MEIHEGQRKGPRSPIKLLKGVRTMTVKFLVGIIMRRKNTLLFDAFSTKVENIKIYIEVTVLATSVCKCLKYHGIVRL